MPTAMKAMSGFTFGADPELFVQNEAGKFVSASAFLPGTKDDPYKVNKGAIQVDGVAAEFNIDPANTFEEFDDNIVTVMGELKKHLPKGHKLALVSSASFDEDIWDSIDPAAKELGCSPDTNAWTGEPNPIPVYEANPRMRCAGGHVHVGFPGVTNQDPTDLQHIMNCRDLVKQLDWFLGGWSLTKDEDKIRRELYGKAGACRYKSYGVEYRTLSNFWLKDKATRLEMWNRMQSAISYMRNTHLPTRIRANRFTFPPNETLVKSINESTMNADLLANFKFPLSTLNADYATF